MSKKLFGMVKTVLAVYGGYKLAEPVITQVKEDVKTYFLDHTLPELKEDIVRGMTRSIETLLFGAPKSPKTYRDIYQDRPKYETPRKDYMSYANYRDSERQVKAEIDLVNRNLHLLTFESYEEADSLLRYLKHIWDDEGQISVRDVFTGAGMSSSDVESKYGWVRIHDYVVSPDLWDIQPKYSRIRRYIEFPPVEKLY